MRRNNMREDLTSKGLKEYVERLQKLQLEYESTPKACSDSIISLNEKGEIVFWNRAAERMLGYSKKEMLGKSPTMLMVEEKREKYTRMFKILQKREGTPEIVMEIPCIKKDGKKIPVEFSIAANRTRHISSFVAVIRDLTKRKDLEERLRESEERYRTMFEHAYDWIWMLDKDGNFTYINKTAEKESGYPFKEVKGTSFASIVVPKDLPYAREVFKRTLEGKSITHDVRIYNSTGQILTLKVNTAPIRKKGEVIGAMTFGRDVTRERESIAKIRESEKLYKLLSDFNKGILDNSPAGIIKLNRELKIEYENPEMRKILGVPPGKAPETIGTDIRELPSTKDAGLVAVFNKLLEGEEISGEGPFTLTPGKEVYLSYRGVPSFEDSKFVGAILLINDITEWKRAEERYANQLKSLIEIGNKMRMEVGLEPLLQYICDAVVKTLGWRQVILSLRDYNTGTSHPVAVAGYDKETTIKILSRPPVPLKAMESYLRDEFRVSRSYYIDHTQWDMIKDYPGGLVITPMNDLPSGGWHEKDVLLVPIYGKEKILGFVSPDNPVNGKRPTENDIRLFEIFADQTGVAIESSRLYAELQASEERYRTLVETAGEGIIMADPDENILFANRAIADILGYRKEELVGTNLSNLTNQDEFAKFRRGTGERKKGKSGKYEAILYSSVLRGGVPCRFIVSAAPLFSPDGTYVASFGVLTDITERKRMEKALQESERKYKAVCENSLTGIYIIQEGRFKFVNRQFERLSGYSRDELLEMEFVELVHPEDWKTVEEGGLQGEKAGTRGEKREDIDSHYEFRGVRKNGEVIWFETIASTIEYQGRQAVLGNLIDITDRKKAALELEKYMRKLEEVSEAKSRFVSTFSHDIRTPLTTVSGYTSLLLNRKWGELTQEQEDRMRKILENTRYINDLVDKILNLSRIESGKTPITLQVINPVEVIEKSIEDVVPIANVKKQTVEFTGERSLNSAYADPKAMRQILNNLISNAIKYTQRNGKIEVSLLENENFLQINVKDNGQGIPKEELDKIFQEFYSLPSRSGKVARSTGLGLAIVKRLAEGMGGTVWVRSEGLDKGSTFSFTFKKGKKV
jgi:PAS domain S-box-containing protein